LRATALVENETKRRTNSEAATSFLHDRTSTYDGAGNFKRPRGGQPSRRNVGMVRLYWTFGLWFVRGKGGGSSEETLDPSGESTESKNRKKIGQSRRAHKGKPRFSGGGESKKRGGAERKKQGKRRKIKKKQNHKAKKRTFSENAQ